MVVITVRRFVWDSQLFKAVTVEARKLEHHSPHALQE